MTNMLQCVDCRHFDRAAPRGTFRCAAFPAEIPDAILQSLHDHREPYTGDRGIRFEARTEE